MSKRKRIFDVRVGDTWSFTTNYGDIHRHITFIDEYVEYTSNGHECMCLVPTFRRWWRGAELFFAKDWTNRDNNGEAEKTP